jgi:hypothetical protein
MGKGRERQTILKTDKRTIFVEMRPGRKAPSEIKRMGREPNSFSKAMFLKLQYAVAAGF